MSLPSGNDFYKPDQNIYSTINGNKIKFESSTKKVEVYANNIQDGKGIDLTNENIYCSNIPNDDSNAILGIIGLDGNNKWIRTTKGGGAGVGGDVYLAGNPNNLLENIYVDNCQQIFKGLVSLNSVTPTATQNWTDLLVIEPDVTIPEQLNISKISSLPQSKVDNLVQNLIDFNTNISNNAAQISTNQTNITQNEQNIITALTNINTNIQNISSNTAAINANADTIFNCARLNENNTFQGGYFNLYNGDVILNNIKTGEEDVLGIDANGKIKVHTQGVSDIYALLFNNTGRIGDFVPPQTLAGNNLFRGNTVAGGITYFLNDPNPPNPPPPHATAARRAISLIHQDIHTPSTLYQEITLGVRNLTTGSTPLQSMCEISHPIFINNMNANGALDTKGSYATGSGVDYYHAIEINNEETNGTAFFPAIALRWNTADGSKKQAYQTNFSNNVVRFDNISSNIITPAYEWRTASGASGNELPVLNMKLSADTGLTLNTANWNGAPACRIDMSQYQPSPSRTPNTNPEIIFRSVSVLSPHTETSKSIESYLIEDSIKIGGSTLIEPAIVQDTDLIISCKSNNYETINPDPTPTLKFRVRDNSDLSKMYDESIYLTPSSVSIGTQFKYASRMNFSTTLSTWAGEARGGVTGNYEGDSGDGMMIQGSPPTYDSSIYSDELCFSCNSPALLSQYTDGSTTDKNPGAFNPDGSFGDFTFRQWGFSIKTNTPNIVERLTKHLTLWCNDLGANVFTTCRAQQRISIGYFETNAPNSRFNFTGTHHAAAKPETSTDKNLFQESMVGKVIIANGTIKPLNVRKIDDACPEVQLCEKEKDKRVIGVVGGYEKDGELRVDKTCTAWRGHLYKDENRIIINALGEGLIWITKNGENLENGDYLCSSSRIGYAQKQDDDICHNYTIAKITEDIIWGSENERLSACIYYCG